MKRLAVVLVAALALSLSGCSSMFAPDPTAAPSTSSPRATKDIVCTTLNSTVSDSAPSSTGQGAFTAVEAAVATFDRSSENVKQFTQSVDGSGVIDVTPYDAFDTFAGTQADWFTNVIDSIHTLGTLPVNLGIVPASVEAENSAPFSRTDAANQTWVRGWVARTEIVPFQVNCPSGSSVLGTLTTFDPAHGVQLELRCDGRSHPRDTAAEAVLRHLCGSVG